VLRVGHSTWGELALLREHERVLFAAEETALVPGLSAPLAEVLCTRARIDNLPNAEPLKSTWGHDLRRGRIPRVR
jgi:hypothetical protein